MSKYVGYDLKGDLLIMVLASSVDEAILRARCYEPEVVLVKCVGPASKEDLG